MERLPEFAGNHPQLFIALGVVLALLAWSYIKGALQGFKNVGPTEATLLINHDDAVVLDIREDHEFKDGYILDSVHIPLGRLKDSLGRLEKYRDRPIIASCRSGSRSGIACSTLLKNGFDKVYNLKGGVIAWQNANLPLKKK